VGSRNTPALRSANPGLALPADAAFSNFDGLGICRSEITSKRGDDSILEDTFKS
jgi:hypothetical protein